MLYKQVKGESKRLSSPPIYSTLEIGGDDWTVIPKSRGFSNKNLSPEALFLNLFIF